MREVLTEHHRLEMGDVDGFHTVHGVGCAYPMYNISWEDAQRFIAALNAYTGMTFRLPSEAEWQYACRAGTQTRFYFGDSPSPRNYCADDGLRSQ